MRFYVKEDPKTCICRVFYSRSTANLFLYIKSKFTLLFCANLFQIKKGILLHCLIQVGGALKNG